MKKYELMYILKANLDEAALMSQKEALSRILTDNGAQITKVTEWGLKDFAYEIKKERKGYYVILNFETETNNAVNEFRRIVALDNNVIRFLIINS